MRRRAAGCFVNALNAGSGGFQPPDQAQHSLAAGCRRNDPQRKKQALTEHQTTATLRDSRCIAAGNLRN